MRKMAARMKDMGHPIYYFENIDGPLRVLTSSRRPSGLPMNLSIYRLS